MGRLLPVSRALACALVTVLVTLAGGCSGSEPVAADLRFAYQGVAEQGMIDQILLIQNDGTASVVPRLQIRPVDDQGEVVSDVTVSTVFGSDHGLLVVAPGTTFDVLAFHGPGRPDVADVVVTVPEAVAVEGDPQASLLAVEAIRDGAPVTRFDPFESIRVSNGNEGDVAARVVFLVYDIPSEGEPQQVVETVVITDHVPVPPGAEVDLRVPPDLLDEIAEYQATSPVSLKAHLTPLEQKPSREAGPG